MLVPGIFHPPKISQVGYVRNVYDKIGVLSVELNLNDLSFGDKILIWDGKTVFISNIKSIQRDRKEIVWAMKGDVIGILPDENVMIPNKHALVYRIN